MGYRSSFILAVSRKKYTKALILTKLPSLFTYLTDVTSEVTDENYEDIMYFHGEDLKMYESYDEIGGFKNWLTEVGAEDYQYARYGEDADDTEQEGLLDAGLWIDVSISFPGGNV